MSKFEQYITEKLTARDISDALKNPNIRIGCEFEFYMDDEYVNPLTDKKPDLYYEDLDDYQNYVEKWKEWRVVFDEWNEKIFKPWSERWMKWQDEEDTQPLLPGMKYDVREPIIPKQEKPMAPEYPDYVMDSKHWVFYIKDSDTREIRPPVATDERYDIRNRNNGVFASFRKWVKVWQSTKGIDMSKWEIKEDPSLETEPELGIEVSTPPMTLPEFLDMVPRMFEFINRFGHTDNTCGFHIGVSLANVANLKTTLDILKLVLFTEEGLIYKYFKAREDIETAKSSKGAIIYKSFTPDVKDIVDKDRVQALYPFDKYLGINKSHLFEDNKYVEFRYLGASGYQKKWKEIKEIVAHYCYNISLACDPNFKKKEYLLKVARLINKIKLATALDTIDVYEGDLKYWRRLLDGSDRKESSRVKGHIEYAEKEIEMAKKTIAGLPQKTMSRHEIKQYSQISSKV